MSQMSHGSFGGSAQFVSRASMVAEPHPRQLRHTTAAGVVGTDHSKPIVAIVAYACVNIKIAFTAFFSPSIPRFLNTPRAQATIATRCFDWSGLGGSRPSISGRTLMTARRCWPGITPYSRRAPAAAVLPFLRAWS